MSNRRTRVNSGHGRSPSHRDPADEDDHSSRDGRDPTEGGPSRKRRRRAGLGLVALGVLAVLTAGAVAVRWGNDTTGDDRWRQGQLGSAASFRLPDLGHPSRPVALADRAGSPAVINFWASWCVPCRREMPALQAAHLRYGDQVTFIGVNHQDSRDAALAFLDETGATYPSGYDPDGDVARRYGLFGLPTTILVAADGEIVARRTGEVTADDLETMIGRLVGGDR